MRVNQSKKRRYQKQVSNKKQGRYQLHDNDFSKLSFVQFSTELRWLGHEIVFHFEVYYTLLCCEMAHMHFVLIDSLILIANKKYYESDRRAKYFYYHPILLLYLFWAVLLWFIYLMPSSLCIRRRSFWTLTQITTNNIEWQRKRNANTFI